MRVKEAHNSFSSSSISFFLFLTNVEQAPFFLSPHEGGASTHFFLSSFFLCFPPYQDGASTFFLILLEGHQTYSVKSKSVSDVDFPDQSECTNTAIASLLDLTSMCLLRRQVSENLHYLSRFVQTCHLSKTHGDQVQQNWHRSVPLKASP